MTYIGSPFGNDYIFNGKVLVFKLHVKTVKVAITGDFCFYCFVKIFSC